MDTIFSFIVSFFNHLGWTSGVKGIAVLILIAIFLWLRFSGFRRIAKSARRRLREWLLGDTYPSPDISITLREIDKRVNLALNTILYRFDACRAWIFEFTTPDERMGPFPFREQDCTYERVNIYRNVKSQKDSLQRMSLAAYPEWTRRLATDMEISLADIAEIKETDVELFKSLESQQIRSMFGILLLDFRGVPFGVLGMDFCGPGIVPRMKRVSDQQAFMLLAIKTAGLLTIKHNGTLAQLAGGS